MSLLLVAGAFGLFNLQLYRDGNMALARTLAVNVFIFGQMFYLFNCRSLTRSVRDLGLFSNPWVWIGSGVMTLFQLVFIYVPVFNTVFGTHPMGGASGSWCWGSVYCSAWSLPLKKRSRAGGLFPGKRPPAPAAGPDLRAEPLDRFLSDRYP